MQPFLLLSLKPYYCTLRAWGRNVANKDDDHFQNKLELENERAEEGGPVPLGAEEGNSALVDKPDSKSSLDAEDTLLRPVGSWGFPQLVLKNSIIRTLSHAVEGIQALLGANIGSLDSKVKCDSQSQSEGPEEPTTARHAIIKDRAAEGTTSISSTREDDCKR